MKSRMLLIAAAGITALGCSRPSDADNAMNQAAIDNALEANAAADAAAKAAEALKGPAGALAVVKEYAALAEQGKYAEAAKHWTNATAAAQFATSLEDYPKFGLTAGTPGEQEGAAGSSFIDIPLTLDLTLRSGSPYAMTCKATLRRVNDVPGSTEEQRRWRIETIDC